MFFTQLTQIEAAPLGAAPCTLAWNPSQDTLVAGYAIYYGIVNSGTTNRLDVEMTNLVTLNNLFASSNYFFYVVAYDGSGIESLPSAVMDYTPPALSSLKLTSLPGGTLSLHFLTATGASCHVEYTPTLSPSQWQTLAGATADANGSVTITDPLPGNPSARFYRTAVP